MELSMLANDDTVRSHPYLSLVVAARNDDHGGNMIGRMQGMIDSWIVQAERYGLPSEIVVVEWNPPSGQDRLKDALVWPASRQYCNVRFVEVPAELHAQFENATSIPLQQMIAKNVGIRRAHGEFVLATNLDIIFSAGLVRFLADRGLEPGVMYRINRQDVHKSVPAYASIQQLLEFCESHIRRVFAREGEFQLAADGARCLDALDIVAADARISFGPGWSTPETSGGERFRWVESKSQLSFQRPFAADCLAIAAEVGPSAGSSPVSIAIVDADGLAMTQGMLSGRGTLRIRIPASLTAGTLRLAIQGRDLPVTRHPRIVNLRVASLKWETAQEARADEGWRLDIAPEAPAFDWSASFEAPSPFASEIRKARYLHTNACGDFTLLSRTDWFSLRGYPEFPIWPMHVDAMFCYAAYHAGLRECILREPMRIYHVEHSSGAGWTPEGEQARLARVAAKKVREMSYPEFTQWVDLMRRYDAPAIFTLGNWGLGDHELTEESV